MAVNKRLGKYVLNFLISVDQFANTLLGGNPDMTISTRLGIWLQGSNPWKRGVAKVACKALDLLDKDHCKDARE